MKNPIPQKFSLKETVIVFVLFSALVLLFSYAVKINYYYSQLDSAMMVGNIESTYSKGYPISQINASAHKVIATVVTQKAKHVCALPLREDTVERQNMFKRHGYFILYVLAPFNALVSALTIASVCQALTFVGLLFAIYLFLRKEHISIPATLLFMALVVVHPAWSASAFGEFYPDRYFILVGFVYVVLLQRSLTGKSVPLWALWLVALVAASLTERAAIMIGISTLAMLVLHRGWRGWNGKDIPIVGIAVAVLFYALLYMKLVQHNSEYGSYSEQAMSFFSTIQNNEHYRLELQKYLWVNLPYLILTLFEWRMALLAFGAMLPNIVGSIGGAEKIGWSTHYHSMYFPFLVAAAGMGFMQLCRLLANKNPQRKAMFFGVGLIVLYMAESSPFVVSPFWQFKAGNIWSNAIFKALGTAANVGEGKAIRVEADFHRTVAKNVPSNVSVSTYEGMMPALLGHGRVLHYYPLGIGSDDYVVVGFKRDNKGKLKLSGAVSYLGAHNLSALNDCLSKRIEKNYRLVKLLTPGAPTATNYGAAIFKRIKKE